MLQSPKLIHEIVPVGMLKCNCHILGDPETREALVIDPGDDAGEILNLLEKHKLKVRAILSTHAHIDHVGGLWRIHQATGAPVAMHADDLDLYRMLDIQAQWIGMKTPEKVRVDGLLKEGDTVRWGPFVARVLHTPGHTRGSVSLYLPSQPPAQMMEEGRVSESGGSEPGRLFAGDTLFAGSIGRTDLWGGSFETIMRSLRDKLLQLPDDTIVYPGHGESTTVAKERETNPFLAGH